MTENGKKKVLPLLAMLIFFITAWGLDQAKTVLKNYRSSTLNTTNLWVDILLELVFAGLAILLVWLVLIKFKRSALVGWGFVVVGLLALILSSPYHFYITNLFNVEVPPRYIRDDYSILMQGYFSMVLFFRGFIHMFSIFGFFTRASAFATALGVANFFRKAH
jgi:hypothetical protein